MSNRGQIADERLLEMIVLVVANRFELGWCDICRCVLLEIHKQFITPSTWCDHSGHGHAFQTILDSVNADVVLHTGREAL